MFERMRKALGNKRNQISDAQIADITRVYGDFAEGERVRILPNEAFGYMRITVERPLRLRSMDGPMKVSSAQLKELLQTAERDETAGPVMDLQRNLIPDPELRDHENGPLPAIQLAYEQDVAERLRRSENIAAVNDYMQAEVLPWVVDAWVDIDKTKVGYEIPLTTYFYKYTPPRSLAEIDAEITALEAGIQRLLAEVTD
jgi:type I restriction enzyme M protein